MSPWARIWCLVLDYGGFTLGSRVVDDEVEAPSTKRVSQTPFLIRGHEDERDSSRSDRPHLWNRQCPGRQQLKQQGFKRVVDLIDLVDEKDTTLFFLDCGE